MKKILVCMLAMFLLLTCFAGCNAAKPDSNPVSTNNPVENDSGNTPSAEPVEVVFWHTYTDHHEEALLALIDGFNASQTQYKVVAEQQPYSEMNSKLLQAATTGNGPDFCPMFASDAVNYIENGFLYDMTDLINDPEAGIPNFKEQTIEGLYKEITQWGNERIYMVPITMASEVLFYNKTMLDNLGLSAPTTWEEVETCAKAIYNEYGVAGFGTDSVTDTFQGWMIQEGSDYIDVANKQIAIDRDTAIEKLDWFANGVKEGYFRLVGEDFYFSNPFGSQRVGMYVGSSAGIDYALAAIPEGDGSFELGCCPLPQSGTTGYISSWGSTYVCLSRDEAHAKGVVAFLSYMSQKDNQISWAEHFGALPVRVEAIEDPAFQAYAETNLAVKALSEEYQNMNYLPSVLGAATVRTEIDKMVLEVAQGINDSATAFDNFVAAANAALNDN